MKKLISAVPIFIMSALLSGCLHGDLDINMGDGLTTKNAVQNQLADMGMSIYPADYTITCAYFNTSYSGHGAMQDTVTGTITITTTTTTTYNVISAELEYEEPDSQIFTSNCRRYGFKFYYIDSTGAEQELVYQKLTSKTEMMGYTFVSLVSDTRLETYPGVTKPYGGVDAYYAFLEKEFDFKYTDEDYVYDIGTSSSSMQDTGWKVEYDCHFKRTSELSS